MDQDDLLTTAAVSDLTGKSIATINRWAVEGKLSPAVEMPGQRGARLFRRVDVEALLAPHDDEAGAS